MPGRNRARRRPDRPAIPAALFAAASILSACQVNEPRLLEAADARGNVLPIVAAFAETEPVASRNEGPDDAVIVVSGERGWIVGADETFGLRVYDLAGRQLSGLAVGSVNNVDAVDLGDGRYLLAGSNRSAQTIDLFTAEPRVDGLSVRKAAEVPLALDEPYGLCMTTLGGDVTVFVGDRTGRVERWLIDDDLRGSRTAVYEFDSQTEGCVVDDTDGALYVGEETVGIWVVHKTSGVRELVDRVGAGRLVADVKGLDIYDGDERVLIASSRGDDAFVLYRLPGGEPMVKFRIGPSDDLAIDGATGTDGVAATAASLPRHPAGLLVVKDGHNRRPPENPNFKLVDWREIEQLENAAR